MSKQFEDEFIDLQSELVSLCLEVTEKRVDKIYAMFQLKKKVKCLMLF